MTILYTVKNNLYLNITNRCPCRCTFCLRQFGDGAYGSGSLWLEREPSRDEITGEIDRLGDNIKQYGEAVFCGYGEPMERAADVSYIGRLLKEKYSMKVRLNTNGLGDRINNIPTAHMLEGSVDIVSISLNSGTKKGYNLITRPKWEDSFDSVMLFAEECKKYVPEVIFTVVDIISEEDIVRCREISKQMRIPLRVRHYDN